MNSEFAVAAAIGCAICNAVAAILQKVSTDKVTKVGTYNLKSAARLLLQAPYVAGVFVDLFAGIMTLVAVHKLPLFLVQAIIASSVVLTAIFERIILKRRLKADVYVASLIVVAGLCCLAASAQTEKTAVASSLVKHALVCTPVVLAFIGYGAAKLRKNAGAFALATLSGVSFGAIAIIGRLMVYPDPIWLALKDPFVYAMAAYGIVGLYHFTAALQRTIATTTNGIMLSAQTVVPLVVGIFLLGDTARDGMWSLVWAGCALVTGGCVYIAFKD